MGKFELGQKVGLVESNEKGTVTGRSEYLGKSPRYQVRFMNAVGCKVTEWFSASDICCLPDEGKKE